MSRLGLPPLLDPDGFPLFSLREINRLPPPQREAIYRELLPTELLQNFNIDLQTLCGKDGRRKVEFVAPEGLGLLRIDVRLAPEDRDSLFFVEVADTPYQQIELSFCFINDPAAPRFDIDVDAGGRINNFATVRRNLAVEEQAMRAGLFPHQVRRGLRMFGRFFARFERFVDRLGIGLIVAEPLSYDNAIRYERYGFDYLAGKRLMHWIDESFRPGGELERRLDDSIFRRRSSAETLLGRSWAIHDGILGRPWDGIRIYKVPGVDAGLDSFPGRKR